MADRQGIGHRHAFEAIYLAFLGRRNGPRAGWLLASLPADFVRERLLAASEEHCMSVHIFPVPGNWLPGVPAAEADVDEEEAAALVATGAFSLAPIVYAQAGAAVGSASVNEAPEAPEQEG